MIAGMILWFSLSLGIQDGYIGTHPIAPVMAEISVNAENDWLHLYGTYENQMMKIHSIWFEPRQDLFTIGGSIQFNNVSFHLEHQCSHSVNPYGKNPVAFDTWYNRAWIQITNKEVD